MTSAPRTDSDFEVVVVGGGHAGCEAALAAARLGHHTALVTQNPDTVAAMACNCSIGGPGKAHLVREIDALGGEMGRNIDRTFTHIRLLNASRGPAVQALRAQADKALYRTSMKRVLESQDRLWLIQDTVTGIDAKGNGVRSVALLSGRTLPCAAVVVCTGTFLNGLIHMGEVSVPAGRAGEAPATHLSGCLAALGLPLRRFKTGTVPRVLFSSIDLRRVRVQPSEPGDQRFARLPVPRPPDSLLPCHVTSTNARTHALLRANSRLSALWSGRIEGTGPRYCPSMEAKLQRFPERDAHIVFLEREGWQTEEVYVQGISSAMPADVQLGMLHTIKGLERAHMTRPGYAIEYDSVDASCLEPSLALSALPGLFFAGQVNGTSGYEEAAAQGLIAGINAARYLQGRNSLVLSRHDGYIGVMLRDLTAVHLDEPYRMLTSRAEFRLIFGQDLAWERLAPTAEAIGLAIREPAGQPSRAAGAQPARSGLVRGRAASVGSADQRAAEAYFRRDRSRLRSIERMSDLLIPHGLRYADLPLRLEARERLAAAKPANLGQAAAVPGITPADIATLHAACAAFGKRARECFT